MTSLINDIQSLPLWFSIPLGIVYLAALAYFIYTLWHYRRKNNIILLLFTIASLASGQKAHAESTFTVSNGSNSNTFTIKRSETGYAQKVLYRTVNLTAYAGQHYTAKSGELEFLADDDTKTVTVSELTPSGAYAFQNGTSRSYKLEVTDRAGNLLDYATRNITTGNNVSSSGLFDEKSATIRSSEVTVTDDGYAQSSNPHTAASTSFYTAGTQAYLGFLNSELHMTLEFQAKEVNDGYQYVQILTDNTTDCDTGAGDGNPGTPSISRYMAGFDIGGKGEDTYYKYSFPVTSVGNNAGATKPWSGIGNTVADLVKQMFNTNCRATDGKLILPTNFSKLVVRLNASGNSEDDWKAKNIKAYIQATADVTAPTKSAVSVNPGRHAKGNTVYVSVAFSEIVKYTGTQELNTNWGTLSYVTGSGTNVLTFSGVIPQDVTENLSISSISGTIKDLAGNSLSGGVSADNLCSVDGDLTYALNDFYTDGSGNYLIACHDDLWGLAGYVNGGGDTQDKSFLQVTDIAFPHNDDWNNASSTENNFTAIGNATTNFQGTFNGQNHTISYIRIYKGGTDNNADSYQGLFGETNEATIKNVTLADARITGKECVGGIAGYIVNSTLENCTVGANVCIHAVANNAEKHGGVVGNCNGRSISGCISAATLTLANDLNVNEIMHYGGIVGDFFGNMTDCLAIGATVPAVKKKAYDAIAVVEFNSNTTNCYYHACTVAGVERSNIYAITLGNNVTLDRTASATLPGTNNRTYTNGADINGQPYGYKGATITLAYSGTVNTGYHVEYSATAGTISDNTLTMPAEAVTVSATVPANSYTVRLHHNDGTDDYIDMAMTYGVAANIQSITREDYVFTGWTSNADGSGTSYTDGQSVSNLSAEQGATVDLYAQWRQVAGSCGDNARWSYDDNGTLSITGTGGTDDYDLDDQDRPWEQYIGNITTVSIGSGITYIGEDAFAQCSNLATINGGNDLTDVDECAFNDTPWLTAAEASTTVVYLGHVAYIGSGVSGDVTIADGIITIADGAFDFNSAITSVTIPATVTSIGVFAFRNCTTLTTVNVLGTTPPTLESFAFYLNSDYRSLARTFNVRSAAYKTTGRWADIHNKEENYVGHDNFTMRVVSTLTLPSGVTASTAADGDKVTILGTDYYAEQSSVTLSGLGAEHSTGGVIYRSRATVSYGTDQTLAANANATGQATFTMPAADATVSAEEYACVSYIDEDGTEKTAIDVTLIQSSNSYQELGSSDNTAKWYAVSGEVTISGRLKFLDKAVHLILCDGATLTATSESNALVCGNEGSLTIYGQSNQSGTLTAKNTSSYEGIFIGKGGLIINGGNVSGNSTSRYGINVSNFGNFIINRGNVSASGNIGINVTGDLTINGGIVTATGGNYGIYDSHDVTINGGNVSATGTSYNGIQAHNVTINGGTVSATGSNYGINGSTITLGWTSASDRIYASSYSASPKVKAGQTLTDGTAAYSGSVNISDINGKTLWSDLWDVAGGNDGSTAEKAYTISDTQGLDLLATLVNSGNEFSGKFFKLVNTITYDHTTAWDDATSEENNFTAIGGYYNGGNKYFCGTFDGQGNTVSGIRIYKAGTTGADSYQGLFGETWDATIKNVILADARITGKQNVGGIAGYITDNNGQGGIVENCRVGSDVTIHAVAEYANYHGGVVGQCNGGTILGCVSAATLTVADGLTGIDIYGGIVGDFSGNMSDCLALGASVPAVNVNGAIAGTVDTNWGTPTNCYYHGCTVSANTDQSDAYTVTAGTDITVAPAGSADATYDYDGIQRFGDAFYYGGVLYAPETADISLTLGTTIPEELFGHYAATAGTLTGTSNPYTLTMPAEDVTITVVKYAYAVSYIDANGDVQTTPEGVPVFPFTGTETTLGASGKTTWYIISGNLDVEDDVQVELAGDVNIILADGCSFDGNSNYFIESFNNHAFTIYAQSTGDDMGSFEYDRPVSYGNFNIRGGNIYLYCGGSSQPLFERGSVSITGGRVTLCTEYLFFNNCTATLGCTVPTDYIFFEEGITNQNVNVIIKDGQILSDGSHLYSGTLTNANIGELDEAEFEVYRLRAGNTLRTYTGSLLADNDSDKPAGSKNEDIVSTLDDGNTHTVALQGRIFYYDYSWNTLCLPFDVDNFSGTPFSAATVMELDTDGTYFDTSDGTLYLNFKEAKSIEAGKPYLVKWDDCARYYNPVFTNVTIDNSAEAQARKTVTSKDGKVSFCGTYGSIDYAADNHSILFLGTNNTLYYPKAGAHIGAFRCYFELGNGLTAGEPNSAVRGFNLNFDEQGTQTVIGHTDITDNTDKADAAWYTINGVKLDAKPNSKGGYIHGNKKVVIK